MIISCKRIMSCFSIIMLLGLTGCVKKYRAKPLAPLTKQTAQFVQTKKDVTVFAKKMTVEETKEVFNGCHAQTLCPIALTINNEGKETWAIGRGNVGVCYMSSEEVFKDFCKPHFTNPWAVFGIGTAASIVALPVAVVADICISGSIPYAGIVGALVGLSIVPAGIVAFSVASVICAAQRRAYMRALSADITEKMLLHTPAMLMPHESLTKLIFVPSDNGENEFPLTVHKAQDIKECLIFNINLATELVLDK